MSDAARQFVSPFSARYASKEMSYLFSSHYKITLFRNLWIALAEGQQKLGLPISKAQIAEMKKSCDQIDTFQIREYEKKFRHDVMAHIHAFGDLCPEAKSILHLGATSTYVTDNGDLIQMKEALTLLFAKLVQTLRLLASFAKKHAKMPCLGSTHYQSAQPTTIGKRASLWLQDFYFDAQDWKRLLTDLPFLGAKGATGTQSSFLALFDGKASQVKKLEEHLAHHFGFGKVLAISGQTYTRKLDVNILNALSSFAASAHKMGTDLRLMAHDGELFESFDKTQVGSSAMPYKRNPIYAERLCGLSRFLISLAQNPTYTAATQWLERSLDDSSNRRLSTPEAFLAADAILNLLHHLILSLTPSPQTCLERLETQLPYLCMENILMAAVKKGGDRQDLHEKLRRLSLAAQKKKSPLAHLQAAIARDSAFQLSQKEIQEILHIPSLIGRAPEQVTDFLKSEMDPFLTKYKALKAPIQTVDV